MDAAVVVAIIVGIFFVVGLVVGGVVVIALPVLKDRRSRRDQKLEPGDHATQSEYDKLVPDERPRWPSDGEVG